MLFSVTHTHARARSLVCLAVGSLAVVVSLFFCVVQEAFAVSSDFTVRTLIGDDTTPPTVPTGLTATPVAMTQIDLSWNASTDDYVLSGYHVYRYDALIATTTGTTYADVGLTASTTYAYYVTAFDSFNNISASSSVVATTTFATPTPPVTPTTTPSGPMYGSKARLPELVSLEVIPSQYGALIRFETKSYVRSVVRWGRSISYELGSSAERSFSTFHEIHVDDLKPGTLYRFIIEGETHMGRFGTLTESSFTTLPGDDVTPPGVVTGLALSLDGRDVVLSWQNPRDADFDHVRVVRSTTFFPQGPTDGWVVYDDDGTRARDADIALPGARIYYSVFAYDAEGNMSAPAVISVSVPQSGGGTPPPVVIEDPSKNEIALMLDDIVLYQDERKIVHTDGTFTIDGSRHLTVSIPYDVLPEHLKTILVTITPKQDETKQFQFLLRVNNDKTAYTARLAPLGVSGEFSVRVSVFDFKTAQVGYVSGTLTSVIALPDDAGTGGTGSHEDSLFTSFLKLMLDNLTIVFIVFLIMLAFLVRRLLHDDGARE